jgi:GH15 family glucan-1,4-alpha-glucosidase
MQYRPIEDHGVIGDLHTVALVGIDGSIDFLCFPHFDSPSVFAALLDREKGGHFKLAPVMEDADHRQLYLPDSPILLTRFLSREGVAEVSDFMPVEIATGFAHNLVRRAKTVRGEVRFRMECMPAFDYARAEHSVRETERGVLFESRGADGVALSLTSDVPLEIRGGKACAEFTLGEGETAAFVLEDAGQSVESPCGSDDFVAEAFKRTMNFWRAWVGRSRYRGRWRETVNRSAMTLKLLTSQRHGSIVAAPTFGLPEEVGGVRNWDYRYTWIRDASFTLYGLLRLGYTEEARRFTEWLAERCGETDGARSLQVLYGIDGRHRLDEEELPHLSGYRGSRPVRIGNDAYHQLQLDIYGELMDAVYLYDKYGDPIGIDFWSELRGMLSWLEENWQQADEGLWEVRGGRHHFLYSRLMCWVAFDRAIRMARRRSLPGPLDRWHGVRDRIHADIYENFWDEGVAAFVQARGSKNLDASTLIMPLVRFIGPTDPRWTKTREAIEKSLVSDSLVYRYNHGEEFSDGLAGKEGTFSMCSFWYVEGLSRSGDLQKARFYFEKMLGYANHLGLFGEELGPRGEHLGNFPQAFTHIALISTAYDLDRRLTAAGEEC